MGRRGPPAELASIYVQMASSDASFTTGHIYGAAAGGGQPYVETSGSGNLSEAERDRISETLRIAERLGGQAVTVPAASVVDGVLDYAGANNVTNIVASKTERSRLPEFWRCSTALELIDAFFPVIGSTSP
jgi:hypothetical protein